MTSFSDCVEAHITGIQVGEDAKTISISIRPTAGKSFMLKVEGIDRCIANEFRERNIIDRVSVWNNKNQPEDIRELLAVLVAGTYQLDIDPVFDALIDQEIAAIARGEKILVEIEPVYGVWAVILAQRVLLVE
jgi:hypothetical protein